jgi:regulator of replication initiation timing
MDKELLDALEGRITSLLAVFNDMKQENQSLREEKCRLLEERDGFKARIDLILKKLEGI